MSAPRAPDRGRAAVGARRFGQAQILELLARLRQEFSLTMILISHSLPVVAQLASRVAVMQAGRFVESGAAEQVLQSPQHPYTQALVAAVPDIPA